MFIKTGYYEFKNTVAKGPYLPKTTVNRRLVQKTKDQCTQEDFVGLSKNCKVVHILYCELDANEYNHICACGTAKEIWDKLVVAYEGRASKRNKNQYVPLLM